MTNWELYTRDYDEEHLRREVTQSLSLISGRTALNCHAGIVAFGGILLLPELAFPMESWTRIASGKTQKTSSIGLFLGDIAPEPADDSHNKLYKWVAIGMLGTSALLRTIASSGSDAQVTQANKIGIVLGALGIYLSTQSKHTWMNGGMILSGAMGTVNLMALMGSSAKPDYSWRYS
eukprot:CAMPEP_0184297480 /NCGR_PEP_ID=MMETSP1049-20130417/8395_1 /TAXON_ID=77928 /ORGANISM="Proteomonas sulcata, Strain CCMP704" /LENGTH=176 /DNA_ID=CAMNT_0026607235 /DNA_START=36 /DNA_END=566 /DNA_ORIENTATION=+